MNTSPKELCINDFIDASCRLYETLDFYEKDVILKYSDTLKCGNEDMVNELKFHVSNYNLIANNQ